MGSLSSLLQISATLVFSNPFLLKRKCAVTGTAPRECAQPALLPADIYTDKRAVHRRIVGKLVISAACFVVGSKATVPSDNGDMFPGLTK